MNNTVESRPFGLVAGLGVGASIFYYKAVVEAHLARGLSARLVMVHADASYVMKLVSARETHQLAGPLIRLLDR